MAARVGFHCGDTRTATSSPGIVRSVHARPIIATDTSDDIGLGFRLLRLGTHRGKQRIEHAASGGVATIASHRLDVAVAVVDASAYDPFPVNESDPFRGRVSAVAVTAD